MTVKNADQEAVKSHFLTYPEPVKMKLIRLAKSEMCTPSQWVKRRVMEAPEPAPLPKSGRR